MPFDLTDEERQLLVNTITVEIEASKFPLSPRIEALKRIREKLLDETEPPPQTTADAAGGKRAGR